VIPREGVERHCCSHVWIAVHQQVIPREGVESSGLFHHASTILLRGAGVIPREGVESAEAFGRY